MTRVQGRSTRKGKPGGKKTVRTNELLLAEPLGELGLHVDTQVANELAACAAPVYLTEPLSFLLLVPRDNQSVSQTPLLSPPRP